MDFMDEHDNSERFFSSSPGKSCPHLILMVVGNKVKDGDTHVLKTS